LGWHRDRRAWASGLIAMASEAAHAKFAPRLSADAAQANGFKDDLRLDRRSVSGW